MSALLDDIKIYFRQFPFGEAFCYSAARTAARIFDRAAMPTYSQFGEDRILPLFLSDKKSGFYVDVGANHPTKLSNTFWLYKRGWSGVTIEPNASLSKLHHKVRPRDIQIQSLVSDTTSEVEFVEFENGLFSSASQDHAKKWEGSNRIIARRAMIPRTLTSILDEYHSPLNIDLLCVDVEGWDISVLRSLDWVKYHPTVVVVEMSDFVPMISHPTLEFLMTKGFSLKAFDGFNGFFKKAEPPAF
jgi:FkbM family methyltransferase